MRVYKVQLPDALADFVDQCVADGDWETVNQVFEQSIASFRIACMLGGQRTAPCELPAPSQSVSIPIDPAQVPVEQSVAAPTPEGVAVFAAPIDLTRTTFDSPAFMADLMDKLRTKK